MTSAKVPELLARGIVGLSIALIPLTDSVPFESLRISITDCLLVLGFLFSLLMGRRYWMRLGQFRLVMVSAPLILATAASSMAAPSPGVALRGALNMAEGLILAVLVSGSTDFRRTVDSHCLVIAFGGLIEACIIIAQHSSPEFMAALRSWWPGRYQVTHYVAAGSSFLMRSVGTFAHPNLAGAYLLPGSAMCVLRWILAPSVWQKSLWASCLVVVLMGVYYTYSRGALLGCMAGLVAVGFLPIAGRQEGDSPGKRIVRVLLVVGLVGFALQQTILGAFPFSDNSPLGFASRRASIEDRFAMWTSAFQVWKEYPLLGVGFNNLSDQAAAAESWLSGVTNRLSAHNLLIEVLATTGVLGLISFMYMLGETFSILRGVMRSGTKWEKSVARVIVGYLTMFLAHSMVDCYIADKGLMFIWWLFVGIANGLRSVSPGVAHTRGSITGRAKPEYVRDRLPQPCSGKLTAVEPALGEAFSAAYDRR